MRAPLVLMENKRKHKTAEKAVLFVVDMVGVEPTCNAFKEEPSTSLVLKREQVVRVVTSRY